MSKTAKTEFQSITQQQQRRHSVETKGEEVKSLFSPCFEKVSWHTRHAESFTASVEIGNSSDTVISEDKKVNYSITGGKFDILTKVSLVINYPEIKVKESEKEKVRICYVPKLAHKTVKSFDMHIDSEESFISTMDERVYELQYQLFIRDKKEYRTDIGDIEELKDWTNHLPAFTADFEQPFFYSMAYSQAFPLFLVSDKSQVIHTYVFTHLKNLIKMQVLDEKTDKWVDTEFDYKYTNLNEGTNYNTPILNGIFSFITEAEKSNYRCQSKVKYFFDDIVPVEKKTPEKIVAGGNCMVNFPIPGNSRYMVALIKEDEDDKVFVADNKCPVAKTEVYYGGLLHQTFVCSLFTRSFAREFPERPDNKNILCFPLSHNLNDVNPLPGKDLQTLLTNYKFYFDKSNDKREYDLSCLLAITKELCFSKTENKDNFGNAIYRLEVVNDKFDEDFRRAKF